MVSIVQPGVKTPIVSYVPSTIIEAIQDIEGIQHVSPEIMALVMLKDKPVTIHGITAEFTNFINYKTIEGETLSSLFSSNNIGFIAGYNIAKINNLELGKTYELYSTTTESYVSMIMLGVTQFNSLQDDELFIRVESAKFFRTANRNDEYSLIQLKYDPDQITKSKIEKIVFSEYTVKLIPYIDNEPDNLVQGVSVDIYDTEGTFIEHQLTGAEGEVTFNLHIGNYKTYLQYLGKTTEKIITVKSDIEQKINLDFRLSDLQVKAFYDGKQIDNASIQLLSPYWNLLEENTSQHFQKTDLWSGTYYVYGYYQDIEEFKTITLQQDTEVELLFNSPIKLNVTAQGIQQTDYNCTIMDLDSQIYSEFTSCQEPVYLPQGYYQIVIDSQIYGTTTKEVVVETQKTIQQFNIEIGIIQTNFEFLDENHNPWVGMDIFYKYENGLNYSYVGKTSASGKIQIQTMAERQITLKLSNNSFTSEFYYLPLQDGEKIVQINQMNTIRINVYENNGQTFRFQENVSIKVNYTGSNTIYRQTNEQGYVELEIPGEQLLNIEVNSSNQLKQLLESTYDEKVINFYMGEISFNIQTVTYSDYPLSNIQVVTRGINELNSYQTNQNGEVNIRFPTATEQNDLLNFYQLDLYTQEQIRIFPHYKSVGSSSSEEQNNEFYNYFFEVGITWQDWKRSYYIPRSYLANDYELKLQIPNPITTEIKIEDIIGQSIKNSVITLENIDGSANSPIYAITNTQGLASINIEAGTYKINVIVNGYKQEVEKIITTSEPMIFSLPILKETIQKQFVNWNLQIFSSVDFKDQFLGQSTKFIFEISTIFLMISIIILALLLNSTLEYSLKESEKEIQILKILGATKGQIVSNLVIKTMQYSLIGSILGILFGTVIINEYAAVNKINILGFEISPTFSLEGVFLGIIILNTVIFMFVLTKVIKNEEYIKNKFNMNIKLKRYRKMPTKVKTFSLKAYNQKWKKSSLITKK